MEDNYHASDYIDKVDGATTRIEAALSHLRDAVVHERPVARVNDWIECLEAELRVLRNTLNIHKE